MVGNNNPQTLESMTDFLYPATSRIFGGYRFLPIQEVLGWRDGSGSNNIKTTSKVYQAILQIDIVEG